MPTGDAAEVGGATLRSEAVEQKRNSIANANATDAEPRASVAVSGGHDGLVHYDDLPTPEEMRTLRRVPEKIPIKLFSIAFIELCERFSYYGTTIVFTNFIQRPLPEGSLTGADPVQPGVLGMGQRASTGITTFNQFWQYFMPLFGAYIADQYWGRYKTICWALGIDIIGHIILITSAIPGVIPNQSASLACMILGIIVIGFGTGGFKPNVNPMIVEQLGEQHMHVKTLKSGERVIVDPAVTNERIYLWFYFSINVGALAGQVSMFWLSYTLPTIMLCLCPAIMIWGRKRYSRRPPGGSVLVPAWRTFVLANKGRWSINPWKTYKNLHDGTFWENVKPSKFTDASRPKWMTFDDNWVEEVRRGANACAVFCWYPLFWLCYNQTNNNLVSQAATMKRHGVPNDVITNLNPFSLLIFIPLNDFVIYPFLRKMGIRFTPIKKIACGFFAGCSAMIWSAVVQHYIYSRSECGKYSNGEDCPPAEINVWAQSGSYILIALSEVFASITSLEYAYTKAPKNMRSMVQAFALFMNAFAAALGQALVALSDDPLLVWNYTTAAILAFIGGTCFYLQFRHLDIMEDHLNELPEGLVANKVTGVELPGPKRISDAGAEDTVDDEKRI
ncbi:peptide transporter-like protein [Emericellopsis cladophorae]|uniref:Peptide transporter-like protein n=1 Tax=Emericellopsis cladophorae TaxID=2686198 RepID=A0A9Q0BEJ3_9HYPO|nr:peptide transporter-like protein [Emericellopsis cladophorae]KAI6782987.1 peptide transporter-like protein [Emericellopsis cladophorae]